MMVQSGGQDIGVKTGSKGFLCLFSCFGDSRVFVVVVILMLEQVILVQNRNQIISLFALFYPIINIRGN